MITGGHVTPAIAVIEAIKKRKLPWEIVFIGRRNALEGSAEDSEEYRLVTGYGVKFLPLSSGRLLRTLTLTGIMSLFKIPWGFIQAWSYVSNENPDLILSFGGYLALPVALAAAFFRVPVVTHEQTGDFGLANKIIGLISKKILVSNLTLLANLPTGKGVFTGLPVREELFSPPKSPSFDFDKNIPLIYITGGATGAKSLNELIFPIVPELVKKFMLVHQVGGISLVKALELKRTLGETGKRFFVAKYFDTEDISWIYHQAVLVIGRSGANTTAELSMLSKPAVLIPLPWSAGGEQKENALVLARAGSAVVVDQNKTNSSELLKTIEEMLAKIKNYQSSASEFSKNQIRDGAARVVNELIQLLS